MGVVKNLMVRVGADLSGLVSGFSKAGGATGNFQKKAAKDISSLKESLSQMKGSYTSITEAAKDIDLTKSVSKQIKDATKELDSLQKTAATLEKDISFWGEIEPTGMQYQTQALKESLAAVDAQTDSVARKLMQLENIQSLGESVGIKDVTHSSLNKLQMNIASLEDDLRRAEAAADGTSDAAKDMGNTAKAAGNKVKAASAGIAGLRKQSKASAMSVSDLARSLKRVGVVAVGMKLAGAVLGEFRSMVTSYISQNETLQAKVDELKNGFGQALAPAINVAANALSKLMPYVLGVSNAIGGLISNLFGSGWTTVAEGASAAATATNSAAAAQKNYNRTLAGFDQITKLGSESSSAASSASSVAPAAQITLPTWLADLPTKLKEAFAAKNFKGVGSALAEALSSGFREANESEGSLGGTIAKFIRDGADAVSGFVEHIDWSSLYTNFKTNFRDLFTGIDWKTIARTLGAAVGGIGTLIWDVISDAIAAACNIGSYFQAEIEAAGGNIIQGIWNGIVKAVSNVGAWIRDNIFMPFVEGFMNTFDMHSPSKNEQIVSLGSNIIGGIFNGITSKLANVGSWIRANVFTPISEGFSKVFGEGGFFADLIAKANSKKEQLSVEFQAKLTSWKENLSNKFLEFKANIKKGWTGTLAKALGIDSIVSTLNLKLPKISIDWKTVSVLGKDFRYPTGFNIKWNAKGAILDGAQLFGRVGNTWLGGGEAGREALLPLDRNTGWMDKIADRVATRISSGSSGEQSLVIYLELDGKVITKTVVRNINAQAKATGKNPLAACM